MPLAGHYGQDFESVAGCKPGGLESGVVVAEDKQVVLHDKWLRFHERRWYG